jgi:heme exporter protein D
MSETHVYYIMGAYAVTVVALALEVVFLLRRKRETKT